jgi:DNA-binding CsgD family transcriptional regulator
VLTHERAAVARRVVPGAVPSAVESRLQAIKDVFQAHHDRLRALVDEVVSAHDRRAPADVSTDLTGSGQLPRRWSSLDLVASAPGLEWLAGAAGPRSRTRVLCDTRVLSRGGAFAVLRDLLDGGAAIRVGDRALPALAVVDGTRVVFWSADGSVRPKAIERPEVAAVLTRVYAALWQTATDFDRPMWAATLTPAQQRVLQLLRLGLSDGEISRAVGTSIQAVRLHVGAILTRLQAPTRFSAGVVAASLETARGTTDAFSPDAP